MGKAEDGHVLVLEGKLLQVLDDLGQLGEDQVQSTLLEDQVGIVGDCGVSAEGTQSEVYQGPPQDAYRSN